METETQEWCDIIGQYGPVETQELSRIQKLGAKALHASWTGIPHVTHFDDIRVNRLEAFRRRCNADAEKGERLSPLPLLMKAVARTLKDHPTFNAALVPNGDTLILRNFIDIGLAIDTAQGLLVGVVRDCAEKHLRDITDTVRSLSERARGKGLSLGEMNGAGFTVSSLGSLGGTGFTPIIPPQQVAILGVSRMVDQPTRAEDGGIEWQRTLPVSLSYDHRAINGADAGRFLAGLQQHVDALDDG